MFAAESVEQNAIIMSIQNPIVITIHCQTAGLFVLFNHCFLGYYWKYQLELKESWDTVTTELSNINAYTYTPVDHEKIHRSQECYL